MCKFLRIRDAENIIVQQLGLEVLNPLKNCPALSQGMEQGVPWVLSYPRGWSSVFPGCSPGSQAMEQFPVLQDAPWHQSCGLSAATLWDPCHSCLCLALPGCSAHTGVWEAGRAQKPHPAIPRQAQHTGIILTASLGGGDVYK